jgi:hypothetical protein
MSTFIELIGDDVHFLLRFHLGGPVPDVINFFSNIRHNLVCLASVSISNLV